MSMVETTKFVVGISHSQLYLEKKMSIMSIVSRE